MLGSPYLYDRKAIFYWEKNHYHLFKDGIQYIVHSHKIKTDCSFANTGQLKRVINASKELTLMSISTGGSTLELGVANQGQMLQDALVVQHDGMMIESIDGTLGKNVPVVKDRYVVDLFSFISALLFSLMLVNFCWLVATTVDVDAYGSDRIMFMINNVVAVFIVLVSQVFRCTDDTGQVGKPSPHFMLE